jgi:eukaryotic-like serine/threonine-protein kinase
LRAYQLRENTSKFEQFGVEFIYYLMVTGELEKAAETLEFSKRLYPRDEIAPLNLSDVYLRTGQWEKVPDEISAIYRIKPGIVNSAVNENLELALQNLNRFDEAKETCQKALDQKYDPAPFVTCLYNVGFINSDTTLMNDQIAAVRGKPLEYLSVNWQSQSSAFNGQWKRSQDLARQAVEMASRNDMMAVAAQFEADAALRNAVVDNCAAAGTAATRSLAYERNWLTLSRTALALSICGATPQANALIDELVKQYPKNTLVNGIWLPASRTAWELRRGNAEKAIEAMESARRFEPAAEFWTYYIRGLAYLKLKRAGEASAEFQKILDHRGYAPLSVLYPLAHLGIARAAVLGGDTEQARRHYEDLLAIWKDADPGFPVLAAAKKEAALK